MILLAIFGILAYFFVTGSWCGPRLWPHENIWCQRAVGVTASASAVSLLGSAIYYFGRVTTMNLWLVLILVALAAFLGRLRGQTDPDTTQKPSWTWSTTLALVGSLVALTAWLSAIVPVQITQSVRSPWLVVPPVTVLSLGLAVFFLYGLIARGQNLKITKIVLLLIFFLGISLAAIIYPLGFGFDPFLHRATMAHIAEFGTISPKPLYYIGDYLLELSGHLAFGLPLSTINRFFLPVISTLLLASSAWLGFSRTLRTQKVIAILIIFFFPLSNLIATTPQSLAFTTTAALLFLSLPRLARRPHPPSRALLALLTATTLLVHPLAGIPALIYFVLLLLTELPNQKIKTTLLVLASCAGAIALPLVFVVQAKLSGLPINFSLNHLLDWSDLGLVGFFGNRYHVWYDGLYLVIDNALWILLALALIGIIASQRSEKNWRLHLPLLGSVLWFINFLLMSLTLEFDFLIEYERADYALRLLTLTMIFLLPHAGLALQKIDERLADELPSGRLIWAGLVCFMITANIYGAYPRHDNYARSAGFNVGKNDFDAVQAIAQAGGQTNYLVLANQAVAAAAVETYGFKKYFPGDIFYYPIPTGGTMYEYFLQMNEAPSRTIIDQAMNDTGAELVFFVVNDYWWQSEKTIENTKNLADSWFAVGEVTIFEFNRLATE